MEEIELEEGIDDKTVNIGTDMDFFVQGEYHQFVREHAYIFSFSVDVMPEIDPNIMVHKINVNPEVRPVRQKKRNFPGEKNPAIQEEVNKLLATKFIVECDYPERLANVVMVKKSNGQWRMCVDFTYLNKACPKGCYPLPKIDQLVDSTSEHALLSFMDAFSNYY